MRSVGENLEQITMNLFVVRTQAGFNKALEVVLGRKYKKNEFEGCFYGSDICYPKNYPSIVEITTGYHGYIYPVVQVLDKDKLSEMLTRQFENQQK